VIERNPITGDAIIVAPDRASRPDAFREQTDRCPFCPGNEADTPPEIWRDGNPWQIRVFPNKFPATGQHEVIVEGVDHAGTFDRLAPDVAAAVVDQYIERYHALSRSSQYVCVFKNHGPLAGATIPHPHSQVLGTPFVPARIAREGDTFAGRCPLCDLPGETIEQTENYRWVAPRGSMMAYEQWIVPKRHAHEMTAGLELAVLLRRAARAMLSISDSFNWIFINFPGEPAAHWYVQLFPRLSMHAGFEFGTGSSINAVDPKETPQAMLRNSNR
jgi:UDPglucose--hexose-1-phosphate uridylyltransferase